MYVNIFYHSLTHSPTHSLQQTTNNNNIPGAKGNYNIANALIEAGADPDDGGKVSTPMMWAAQNGHGNLVTLLLKNGADISKKVQNLTPLQFAVLTGNIPMFKLLVVRGAYVFFLLCVLFQYKIFFNTYTSTDGTEKKKCRADLEVRVMSL